MVKELEVVLSADEPKAKIGWTCHEYMGIEVHLYEEGREYKRDDDGRWVDLESVTDENAIKAGTEILVHGMFGELYRMTVEEDGYGKLSARTRNPDESPGSLVGMLSFGEDDRGAWVCGGLLNTRGLKKLELSSDEDGDA